ncbi:Nucleoside-diphosphatase mig-23 [Aphelenchoides besseyi]|nr:Nucleoside-diphosphatase mig-23 [Aphelenchoides besseyi]
MKVNDLRTMIRRYWSIFIFSSIILFFYLIFVVNSITSEDVKTGDDDTSYGIVIDAGSTGSRLFLYAFNSRSSKQLISVRPVKDKNNVDVVKKVSPGLSSFAKNPTDASDHIMQLLNYASRYVPHDHQPFTPVFIFATAGMRLLDKSSQDAITNSLRSNLPKMTKLQILPEHIQIIDGKWEGIYSWIAVNYVLGRFDYPAVDSSRITPVLNPTRQKTAGMIDMGGASVQIAFELPTNSDFASDSVNTINLGCSDNDSQFVYNIFVTTFLGFGVNEGAKKYEQTLTIKVTENNNSNRTEGFRIPYVKDNCLPNQMMSVSSFTNGTEFLRLGTGLWDSCVSEIVTILKHAGSCPTALKCFFAGIQAPPVSLSTMELYGFSEYWYSMHDILALEGKYDHEEFERKARGFCSNNWSEIKSNDMYRTTNEERLQAQCFKSAWIHAVLHDGFHVDELNHKFQSALHINNQEVPWALGALIYQMRYYPLRSSFHRTTPTSENSHSLFVDHPFLFLFGTILLFLTCIVFLSRYWNTANRFVFQRDNNFAYKKLNQDPYSFRSGQLPV